MNIFKKKSTEEILANQKEAHFKSIDDELMSAHHTPEYKKQLKACWLASRGSQKAYTGDLVNAESDIMEAYSMCPDELIIRVSMVELLWRVDDLLGAESVVMNTTKQSFNNNYSAMILFSFYDRAAAVFADMGKKERYLEYAKKALAIVKTDKYAQEDQRSSQDVGVSGY
jgi:hypothetical protein